MGDRLRVWVTALDAVGHHVTSYAGPVSLSDSSGTLTVTDPGKWHDGVVRETVTIGVPFSGDVIRATAAGGVTGASSAFDVFVRIHHFVVTVSPSVVTRGVDAALTVTAKDAHGNTVAGYMGPVHVSGTAGGLTLHGALTWTGGVGKATVAFAVLGRQRILVVDASGQLGHQDGVSNEVTVVGRR